MCLTGILISLSLSVCVAKRLMQCVCVWVCVECVTPAPSQGRGCLCETLPLTYTQTHTPKGYREEGEVIKPLIAPLWSSCYCLSVGKESVCCVVVCVCVCVGGCPMLDRCRSNRAWTQAPHKQTHKPDLKLQTLWCNKLLVFNMWRDSNQKGLL